MDEIVLTSHLSVPAHLVPLSAITDFTLDFEDPFSKETRTYRFYDYDAVAGTLRFARGNMHLISTHFNNFKIIDMRSVNPMSSSMKGFPILFTGTLRPEQSEVVSTVINGLGSGQVNAPPRFGKTVTMSAITCQLGMKTLLLTHQIDLCQQALNTFYKYTNVFDVEYNIGHPVIGIVNEWSDIDKFDVCLMTYQKFVIGTDGPEMLQQHKNTFGVVLVDESHRAPADRYMDVINSFNSRYRIGFSGTTETKSESHKITNFILGPVIIRAKSNKVPCKVIVVKTRISIPLAGEGDPRFFGQMLTYLANNDKRNTLIANYLKAYADAGHYCISVSDRVKMIESVTKKLVEAGVKAESYHGTRFKTDKAREDCLQRARNKSIPVLNAQRRMTLGLDIPPLTAFFNLLPSANKQNYLQETSRVRTPFPDKTMAYIVDFVDEHPIAYACFNARKKVYQQEGFEITGGM